MMKAFSLVPVFLVTVLARAQDSCVDEPPEVVNAVAAAAGFTITNGCSSQLIQNAIKNGVCKEPTLRSETLRENCCRSCLDYIYPMPETQLPKDGGIFGESVKLYLQAGQSECTGQGSVDLLLDHEAATGNYSDLVIEQDDVYFAGYAKAEGVPKNPDRFFISKMEVGKEKEAFGPEISIGRRLQDASPSNVDIMIVKYCWGGSNVAFEWNPETGANFWDRALDDGTSQYLLDVGAAVLNSKDNLYGNLIYTVRRTVEALNAAGINHEFAGLFWIQGNGDSGSTWKEYGTDLKRLFTQVGEDLDVLDLPVIDTGAGSNHGLYSAKIYSASTIPNCNVRVAQPAYGVTDPTSGCIQGPGNLCPNFSNDAAWLFYGLDPAMTVPPYSDLVDVPDGYDKTFAWFKDFPNNSHSEYDGVILKGRFLANEFIRTFTEWPLIDEMTAEDPMVLFPPVSCGRPVEPSYTPPGEDNICYVDERDDEAIAAVSCDIDTGETL